MLTLTTKICELPRWADERVIIVTLALLVGRKNKLILRPGCDQPHLMFQQISFVLNKTEICPAHQSQRSR
jgi:hypothetical protein